MSITTREHREQYEVRLQKFMKLLHRQPTGNEVEPGRGPVPSRYLPISRVEMRLDELYFGMWELKHFQYQVFRNEVVGQLDLVVLHPVSNTWITRVGTAACALWQPDPEKTDKQIRIHLEKAIPQLRSECVKNAARSLGKSFGRDLNREIEDSYKPLLVGRR